jgi:tRNA G18 (ribose-2'-O)-methylase SpoU
VTFVWVDDPDDPRLAVFRLNERGLSSRSQRRNDHGEGLFMAEGDLVVERALSAGCTPVVGLVDELRPPPVAHLLAEQVTVYAGGEMVRALVTKLGVPNAVVAVFRRPPRTTVEQLAAAAARLVLVEAVDNPSNIGAIIRNAVGLGWDGMITDATSADPLARRSIRVSMGHAVVFPHARATDTGAAMAALVAQDFTVVGLTPDPGAIDIADLAPTHRMAVCVGAERAGLSDRAMDAATVLVRIPMQPGIDSLNVAAATAIACYELRRR